MNSNACELSVHCPHRFSERVSVTATKMTIDNLALEQDLRLPCLQHNTRRFLNRGEGSGRGRKTADFHHTARSMVNAPIGVMHVLLRQARAGHSGFVLLVDGQYGSIPALHVVQTFRSRTRVNKAKVSRFLCSVESGHAPDFFFLNLARPVASDRRLDPDQAEH